jgi:hypothetical protein
MVRRSKGLSRLKTLKTYLGIHDLTSNTHYPHHGSILNPNPLPLNGDMFGPFELSLL